MHHRLVDWPVLFHDAFDSEFNELSEAVQEELLAETKLLELLGPALGRPRVDTLKGSRHTNMKELRFDADDGVWPSRLTRSAGRSCWLRATNRGAARSGSIDG